MGPSPLCTPLNSSSPFHQFIPLTNYRLFAPLLLPLYSSFLFNTGIVFISDSGRSLSP